MNVPAALVQKYLQLHSVIICCSCSSLAPVSHLDNSLIPASPACSERRGGKPQLPTEKLKKSILREKNALR